MDNLEKRKNSLKELISALHKGAPFEAVKAAFEREFGEVSAAEIAAAEQQLVAEGMDVSEIQSLCDVHAAVFRGSVREIHSQEGTFREQAEAYFKRQNRAAEQLLSDAEAALPAYENGKTDEGAVLAALSDLEILSKHYALKENVLFPYLEKAGITAPPKVMWGADDAIRAQRTEAAALLKDASKSRDAVALKVRDFVRSAADMIYKEEEILLPMLAEQLSESDYRAVLDEMKDFDSQQASGKQPFSGYAEKIQATAQKSADGVSQGVSQTLISEAGIIQLPSGKLTLEQFTAMLNTLPFDMTFVDADGKVAYFSENPDRIFPRARSVIGRAVVNCHPPQSVHIVEKILSDLRNKVKDHEDFWIKLKDRYILIRYFAVRDTDGNFLGTLEVSQDIAPIQAIEGEKRLLS
jgi:DUF438 domain-containing protein